jgi:tight adherence protein C
MMTDIVLFFTFATVFFLIIAIAAIMGFVKRPVDERLDRIQLNRTQSFQSINSNLFRPDLAQHSMVATLGQRIAPKDPDKRSMIKQRLAYAGYYGESAQFQYWGAKILFTAIFFVGMISILSMKQVELARAFIPAIWIIGMGFFLPDIYLYFVKRSRQEQIFCGLPDALDLLVVCVEAGLGLDAALQKVNEEIHMSNKVLSEELKLTCAAIRLGQPRNEALHELGERTGVQDLKALVAVLIQADRFGTSIAQALRVHADDMRTRRRQRAEELAAKTTVKLIFPLVVFIFPAIFVVLGGPAVIKLVKTLSTM